MRRPKRWHRIGVCASAPPAIQDWFRQWRSTFEVLCRTSRGAKRIAARLSGGKAADFYVMHVGD